MPHSAPHCRAALLAILAAALAASTLCAYPIPPKPLGKLVSDSELIVVAAVESIADLPDPDWYDAIASLKIKQVLKGQYAKQAVNVACMNGWMCPEPAKYELGTTVLAFLTKNAKGRWITEGLSYGSKNLDPKQLAVFVDRIEERILIDARKNPTEKNGVATWLIRCAEHPATQWDGSRELYDSAGDEPIPLSFDHSIRLLAVLKNIPPDDDKAYSTSTNLMHAIAIANNDKQLTQIVEEFNEWLLDDQSDTSIEGMRKMLTSKKARFVKRLAAILDTKGK